MNKAFFKILAYLLIALIIPICNTASARSNSVLLINDSGEILYQKNANAPMYPASLTKLMTVYLAFEAITNNQASFDTPLKVSKKAENMRPSKLGLRAGEIISMKSAIVSAIIKSANDSSVVIAENLAGSEKKFADMMNEKAKELGMTKTHFTNASGWHSAKQVTTASDMAKLALAVRRDFPEFYPLFSEKSFYYKKTLLHGHNRVMKTLEGAQGMKTGFTSKAGWNIITTAQRGEHTLVGVVLGSESYRARDSKMVNLMNQQFASLTLNKQKKSKSTNIYRKNKS